MTAMPTRIGWIRHGETEWNRLGKIQGVVDVPLSSIGVRQAEMLAERLARDPAIRWHGIVCSDLKRAAETAEVIGKRLAIPVRRDSRLRERSFGDAEGTTHRERILRWGEDWRRRIPNQETDDQMLSRGLPFVREHLEHHAGECWLVVTHGSFLAVMLHAMCPGLEDKHLGNVSLTVLEHSLDEWTPLIHNCTMHLNQA